VKPYYEHNGITIYHADCRELLPEIKGIDALITDPPYGMNLNTDYSGMKGWNGNGKNHPAVYGDDKPFDPSPFVNFKIAVMWGANHFASRLPDSGGWIVWNKRGEGKPSEICFGDCELAWTNVGQSVRMYSHMWHGVARWTEEPSFHPTQKPVALMQWVMKRYTDDEQSVLDPFCGSGTTLVAAKNLGRKAIGIEIEEKYCEIAAKRLSQEVMQF
jgi:site-specific DNA-methyltransferase (adenine-specific)